MITDVRNTFAAAVSVAAGAGTALVGDVIDTGSVHRDMGQGQPVYLVITVDTEIITGGSAGTVKFQLMSNAAATITGGTVHYDSGTLATGAAASNAALAKGAVIACIALPMEGAVYLEYLGIVVVTATTTTTAGKINAFLTLDPTGNQPYKEGVN